MTIDPSLYPWFSIAALVWGLLDCFFGYRVFKLTVALMGGFIGALLGQAAAIQLGFAAGGQLLGILLGALVGGGIAFLLYIAAVFFAGFCFGATLGMLLLSNFHQMVALLSGCVLGVIGGILAVKLQKILLVLATALLGAFRALLATLYFVDNVVWFRYYSHPENIPALLESYRWLMPAILVLAVVGAIAQFGWAGASAGKGEGKKAKSKKD